MWDGIKCNSCVLPEEKLCGWQHRPVQLLSLPLPQLVLLSSPRLVDGCGAREQKYHRGAGAREHAQQLLVQSEHIVPSPARRQSDAVRKFGEYIGVALERQPRRRGLSALDPELVVYRSQPVAAPHPHATR